MFSRRNFVRSLALASLVFLSGCGGAKTAGNSAVKTVEDRFPINVGALAVQMQLAVEPAEMEKGLMFRTSMGANEGMLFIYEKPQRMNFWMRNTELALDIGYFDAAGELREIYQMYPHDERSVSSRGQNLQFALEMNQGWFKQAGVKPGVKIDLKAVAEALKARGLKPSVWGLQ